MKSIIQVLAIIFSIPFIIIYSAFSWGIVAVINANWFIIPIFPQFPILTWLQYAGIIFFINCFVHGSSTCYNLKEEYRDEITGTMVSVPAPWIALLGSWILHLFY